MQPDNQRYTRFPWLEIAIAALLILIGVGFFLGEVFRGSYPTTTPPMMYYWFGGFFGWLWPLFVIFLVLWAIRLAFFPWRRYRRGYYGRRLDPAMDALRQRYARGEITKEQFEQMARDLESHRY